jgi:peptidoglycan/LPS O-acetylase OafA/YrhL
LNSFLVGLFFAGVFRRYQTQLPKKLDVFILLMIPFNCFFIYIFRDYLLHNGLLAFNFGFLILLIAANKGKITTLFNHQFLIHLGNISFAMYLLQNPVFIFFKKVLTVFHIQNEYLLFVIAFPVLIVGSHFTYRLIEIPWQKKIRGKQKMASLETKN